MLLEFRLEKELCVSNTWVKGEEKRKVTFRIEENERKNVVCADKVRTQMVHTKCEGNTSGVSTCLSDGRHRYEENEESSEKDMY